jgi:hypothetical protein
VVAAENPLAGAGDEGKEEQIPMEEAARREGQDAGGTTPAASDAFDALGEEAGPVPLPEEDVPVIQEHDMLERGHRLAAHHAALRRLWPFGTSNGGGA